MGKISGHNKTKSVGAALLFILLFVSAAYAATPQREFELFDRGYKDYLSYQPEKAAGEFRTFLKEFPHSSAKDAVMFWLGKALTQLKSFEEARQVFNDMKKQFPESPFVRYADKELNEINGTYGLAKTMPDTVGATMKADSVAVKKAENVMVKKAKPDIQAKIQERDIQKVVEHAKELKPSPPQEDMSKKNQTPVGPAAGIKSMEPLPAAPVSEQNVVYSAQIGVFKTKKTADAMKSKFRKEGYTVKVRTGSLHGSDVYKVLVGEFADRKRAEAIADKIGRIYGLNTMVTASGAGGEVQLAQADRSKKAAGGDTANSLSGHGEKKTDALNVGDVKMPAEDEGAKHLPQKEGKAVAETSKEEEAVISSGTGAKTGKTLQSPGSPKQGAVYSIQIGVFSKKDATERLKSEFEKEGYPVKTIKGTSKGRDVFKVLIGQFADKNDAKSVARKFGEKYGENTIVSMSEAREEVPLARVEFVKAMEDTKKAVLSSAPSEKEAVKMAGATPGASKDSQLRGPDTKAQEKQNKEEISGHADASKAKKEHANASTGSLKDEKKQAEASPAEKKKDDVIAAARNANKEPEPKGAATKSPEKVKSDGKTGKNAEVLKTENKLVSAPVQPVNPEKPKAIESAKKLGSSPPPVTEKETRKEFVKTSDEQKESKSHADGTDLPPVGIKEIKYTIKELPEYMAASQSLCDKLQIEEILWRTGNDNEDFLNEQVLYDEARSLHISPDKIKMTEMVENYQLDDREADYLQRYLTISGLIEKKIRDMPEEKAVEAITVRYEESDRYMKIVLGADLQNLARKGTPFEEIYRLYPDIVRFSVTGFPELEEGMKEKIRSLHDNEIVVTWSDKGYMIMKPVFKGPVFKPFGDISPGLRDRIRTYVLAWVKTLKEKYTVGPVTGKK